MMMQKLFLLCLVSSLIGAAPIGGADRLIGVHRRNARMGSGSFRYHERINRHVARLRRSGRIYRLFRLDNVLGRYADDYSCPASLDGDKRMRSDTSSKMICVDAYAEIAKAWCGV